MKTSKTTTLKVPYLARVEGEGGLHIKLRDNKLEDVQFQIFEPPRFFEAFLRGREFTEAPDITARICGICPIAYQMSSCHAMERALGVKVDGMLRELRRMIYCGEWIESHVLHVYMLHAPDFLGYQDAFQMAKDHPEVVKTALRLKKIGNRIVALIGGREIHPINVRVGGFYRVPTVGELHELKDDLDWAVGAAHEMIDLTAGFDFPDFDQDYEYVALRHPHEYPFNEGQLISNKGLDIDIADFERRFEEFHVRHSTSLHARIKDRGNYFVGPLARFNLNFDKLHDTAREAAIRVGLGNGCHNPFKSIVVRSVETLHAVEEARRVMDMYEEPAEPFVDAVPRESVGYGCTEAPRGICYHRYNLDSEGLITDARIVPPTSQNQPTIEEDLKNFIPPNLHLSKEDLTWKCEQAIRNYDPCISCSCHFLNLTIDRS